MPRVAVIGRRADVLPFRAAGVEIMEVEDAPGADAALASFQETTEPCVVMVTEDLLEGCAGRLSAFRRGATRVVLAIPSAAARGGRRMMQSRMLVARALGVDLLARYASSNERAEGPPDSSGN